MNKISIKKKLLIHNFLIQFFILSAFSLSLYKALEISTLDKLQSTLKVIILDVTDDILDHKQNLQDQEFDEEKEYKFEPLFIQLYKVTDKLISVSSQKFPDDIKSDLQTLRQMPLDTIVFDLQENYIICKIKFIMDKQNYVLEIATNKHRLNIALENLLYILFFIVPIILIFSTIGGYFLIYKSFTPIEKILYELKNINAKELSKRITQNGTNDEIDLLSTEINNLLQRLEISFDKISQFTSDASHELKTPLTIIRGEIEIALRKERTSEEYKQTLQSSLEEILVIQQTIDDLLFLAKMDDEKHFLEELLYLDEISLESIKELNNFANTKKVEIEVDIQDALELKGYPKLLKIALKNIIKNAISFSHENSKIIVSNYLKEGQTIIEVKDFGIGIPQNEQAKVFEKFYRTDKSRNKESGGIGLGLSICKKIIDIHHGTIEIESVENKGTTVKFMFKEI